MFICVGELNYMKDWMKFMIAKLAKKWPQALKLLWETSKEQNTFSKALLTMSVFAKVFTLYLDYKPKLYDGARDCKL